jgi:tetratricopeptide (TPR) repeat protein
VGTLLTPYGNTLLGGRPVFSWSPVTNATHYLLQVRGAREGWQIKTTSTTAAYPAHQPELTAGKTYQVSVVAYEGNNVKGDSTRRLNILPTAAAQQLSALVQQIHQMGLPEDEKAFLDLNAAYSSRGLIDEAIRLLQSRVEAGSNHPGVYRALGDNLLAAGLPEQAMAQYEMASSLAEASSNAVELNRARTGLRLAALLQQQGESNRP